MLLPTSLVNDRQRLATVFTETHLDKLMYCRLVRCFTGRVSHDQHFIRIRVTLRVITESERIDSNVTDVQAKMIRVGSGTLSHVNVVCGRVYVNVWCALTCQLMQWCLSNCSRLAAVSRRAVNV